MRLQKLHAKKEKKKVLLKVLLQPFPVQGFSEPEALGIADHIEIETKTEVYTRRKF